MAPMQHCTYSLIMYNNITSSLWSQFYYLNTCASSETKVIELEWQSIKIICRLLKILHV